MLIICLLIALQAHSQNLSKNQRVKTYVNESGDTLIQMSISDAKFILKTILLSEISDSLLSVYSTRDSLTNNLITLNTEKICSLEEKNTNLNEVIKGLNAIIANNDLVNNEQKKIIEEQKKEISKQKKLKILGFVASIVLPLFTISYMLGI
jgi:hypothetical protein